MTSNVCGKERVVRGILGFILLSGGLVTGGTIGWILGILGVAMGLSAIFSYCPMNVLIHHNSCPMPKQKQQ